MKILIVDDSKPMRMIVKKTLRDAGFGDHPTSEAADGLEGLKSLRAGPYDIVLCDWNMPIMSGIEMLAAVKAENIKVVFGFVTSESSPVMREIATQGGADFLIGKPFTKEIFQEVLHALLVA